MMILVTGGSGSGKSAFAETRALAFPGSSRVYLATMLARDPESRRRVLRHRQLRAGKGFRTVECPWDLLSVTDCTGSTVLLEDLSNLLANEKYSGPDPVHAVQRVQEGLLYLEKTAAHLIVVTNEVFSDGTEYEGELQTYLHELGALNQWLAARADEFYEVVFGIPVKGH